MRTLEIVLAWGLGVLFVYAGAIKIAEPAALLVDIENYRILPYQLAWLAAVFLPPFEILCGLALWLPGRRRTGAVLLFGLMTVFTIALLSAWVRGLDIHCGCFGKADADEPSNIGLLVLRDLVILGWLGGILFLRGKGDLTQSHGEHGE